MPAPSYIAKDRHGGYLFRITIPVCIRSLFGGKLALRQSLRTSHRPTALKRARKLACEADNLFTLLHMTKDYKFKETLAEAKVAAKRGQISDIADGLSLA